ncbi:MAG: hypothetical protein M3391_02625 [Actinomycetota bacterium]|nr:hypothetical protein [Actinomycetota bacterium]
MDKSELEAKSSKELHDMAVRRAVQHVDARFLWRLLKAVPVAEASIGHTDEAESDVLSLQNQITDAFSAGDESGVADALRPMYLEYLEQHLSG